MNMSYVPRGCWGDWSSMNPVSSLYSSLATRYALSITYSYGAELLAIIIWSR